MTSLAIGAYPKSIFLWSDRTICDTFCNFLLLGFLCLSISSICSESPDATSYNFEINQWHQQRKENKESFLFRLIFFPSPEMIMRREGHQDQERWEWNRATLARHGTALGPNNGEHERGVEVCCQERRCGSGQGYP
jgi:hypothetical protein